MPAENVPLPPQSQETGMLEYFLAVRRAAHSQLCTMSRGGSDRATKGCSVPRVCDDFLISFTYDFSCLSQGYFDSGLDK